eukprot:6924-Heterococcus_DN1.PRE.6
MDTCRYLARAFECSATCTHCSKPLAVALAVAVTQNTAEVLRCKVHNEDQSGNEDVHHSRRRTPACGSAVEPLLMYIKRRTTTCVTTAAR